MTAEEEQKRRSFMQAFAVRTVYFSYPFEEAVFKYTPSGECFVKLRGKSEFKAVHGRKLVADAMLECWEISEEEYLDFDRT